MTTQSEPVTKPQSGVSFLRILLLLIIAAGVL